MHRLVKAREAHETLKFLFVHQNYPGQYREILPRLSAGGQHRIGFLTQREAFPEPDNVSVLRYKPEKFALSDSHPYTSWFQKCNANGIAVMKACLTAARQGEKPDVVIGHAGWGELLFVKHVWPDVPVLGYFEYYFIARGGLINFDPEFRSARDIGPRLDARNAPNNVSLLNCDAGYTATEWQKRTFPEIFHSKIEVFHEGVRTDRLIPDHDSDLSIEIAGSRFTREDELVTYVARNLEPSRGFHIMMRALPLLQKLRPAARVCIVGGDGASYGAKLREGESFRARLTQELGDRVDWTRVHFLGRIPYAELIGLLKLSRCHVYLTAPFIVSWSLLEAMALEKTVVASDVEPIHQFIEHEQTGFLVDFFSADSVAESISEVLRHEDNFRHISRAARKHVVDNYNFETVCYPNFVKFVNQNLRGGLRLSL